MSRHEDVSQVLRHPAASSAKSRPAIRTLRAASSQPYVTVGELSMLQRDPPDHTRLRGLVNKAFTPRAVSALSTNVEQIADELIGSRSAGGRFDLVEDFAYPLPLAVIFELMDIPAEDRRLLASLSVDLGDNHGPLIGGHDAATRRRGPQAWMSASSYFRTLAAERRRHPGDDLISRMIEGPGGDDRLTEDELVANCTLIVVAGHETTANLIANATLALLQNPDQLEKLRADPLLMKSAVEELIRYDSSIQMPRRTAIEDFEVGGVRVSRGHQLLLLVGAANRDPARFTDPERLDLSREDNPHLSFGFGPHHCLGASLARAELKVALNRLVQLPDLELDSGQVEWRHSLALRGPRKLPLRWRVDARSA